MIKLHWVRMPASQTIWTYKAKSLTPQTSCSTTSSSSKWVGKEHLTSCCPTRTTVTCLVSSPPNQTSSGDSFRKPPVTIDPSRTSWVDDEFWKKKPWPRCLNKTGTSLTKTQCRKSLAFCSKETLLAILWRAWWQGICEFSLNSKSSCGDTSVTCSKLGGNKLKVRKMLSKETTLLTALSWIDLLWWGATNLLSSTSRISFGRCLIKLSFSNNSKCNNSNNSINKFSSNRPCWIWQI